MTNKTNAPEQVEKTTEQQGEQAANQQEDPAVALRRSMANNFLQHCLNGAVAENSEHAGAVGCANAIADIIAAVINISEEGVEGRIGLVGDALASIRIGESGILPPVLQAIAVNISRQGKLNMVIGSMLDAAEQDRMQHIGQAFGQMQAAMQPQAEPAPEQAEPVAEVEPAEEVAPVAEVEPA